MGHAFKKSVLAFMAGISLSIFNISNASSQEMTPALKELVAAANKEKEIIISWSSSTLGGASGAKLFEERMAQLYGSTVKIKWSPGRTMPEVGTEIAMRYTSGLPSPTDIFYGYSRNMADLVKYDLFLKAPWQDYAPDRFGPDITEFDNTFVKIQTAYTGIAVSTKYAPYIPTSIDDLLKPEWKGKIATNATSAGFDLIAHLWGSERTLEWAKKFSTQVSGIIRCSETERLLSGEFAALFSDCGGTSAIEAMADGAPLDQIIPPEINILTFFYVAVPKNAIHPNAAKMLITYLLSQEGMKNISDMRGGMDLNFVPGSKTGERVHKLEAEWGKKFINADIAWQLANEEGDKVKHTIKDMIMKDVHE